jgi:hypothetical protein
MIVPGNGLATRAHDERKTLMPLVFLIVGVLFIVLARNNTHHDFEQLLKSEFTGSQSFLVWASAIVILGLIGFFKPVRPITDALIGLIILVLIIHNSGAFAQFNSAIRSPIAPVGQAAPPQQAAASSGAIGTGFGQPVIAPNTTPGIPGGGTVGTLPSSNLGLL